MVLAVGRLELQVTVARRDEDHATTRRSGGTAAQHTPLARAYERAQLDRAVEADRAHWAELANLSGPRLR